MEDARVWGARPDLLRLSVATRSSHGCDGVVFSAETVVPSIIGLTILGDSAQPRFALVAAVSFVVTIVASVASVALTLVSP